MICMFKIIYNCWMIYLATLRVCLQIHEFDLHYFLSASGLVQQAASKKEKGKSDLLTDIDMLLMVEKGIEVENVKLFIDMQKLIINT